MREKAISPLRPAHDRRHEERAQSRRSVWITLHSLARICMRGQIADAAVILTSRSKQLSISARDINRQESVRAMRLKDYRGAHRARVVECAIFATRN